MELSKKIITTITAVGLVLAPLSAYAQVTAIKGGLSTAAEGAKYSTNVSLPTIIGGIIGAALSLLGIVLLGMLIYGGVLWMTAQGEDKKVKDAKETIKNAIIGLVIVVIAYALSDWILTQLASVMGSNSGTTATPPSK
ncbi:MAG: pilin [Patescibacteria group bacterium]